LGGGGEKKETEKITQIIRSYHSLGHADIANEVNISNNNIILMFTKNLNWQVGARFHKKNVSDNQNTQTAKPLCILSK
jgi:hypothetical protein